MEGKSGLLNVNDPRERQIVIKYEHRHYTKDIAARIAVEIAARVAARIAAKTEHYKDCCGRTAEEKLFKQTM